MVELLVSIAVFSIVVTIAVGGFARALRTNRQALALFSINSNVGAAIEQMAREIRTGRNLSQNPGALEFTNADGEDVIYRLGGPLGKSIVKEVVGEDGQQLTDNNVIVETLTFRLYRSFDPLGSGDYPPRVNILLSVKSGENDTSGSLNFIQTTVSSRSQ